MGDWETETNRTTATRTSVTKIGKDGTLQDQGFFQHSTGDTYNGSYQARKKDRSFEMNGLGVYTTAAGDTYTGIWMANKLGGDEEVSIAYTDGSKYEGYFKDWSYKGQGTYIYPDGSILQAEFVNNTPVGIMTLTDPNGHKWLGTAQKGYGWFEPVNHYYDILENTRENRKKSRKTKVNTSSTNEIESKRN